VHSVADLRARARQRLPRVVFDFIDGGAGDEATLRRNEAAFQELRLVPRVFVPCRSRDLSAALLGQIYGMPFGVTPMGLCNLAWPGTDLGIARAAAQAGIPYALSTMASTSIEDIARAAPEHTWFQLYVGGDAAIADSLLDRALAAGIRTLVLTVDANFTARRLRDRRNHFALPLRPTPRLLADLASHPHWSLATLAAGAPTFENFKPTAKNPRSIDIKDMLVALAQAHIDWSLLQHARARWPHRLIVKGVLHPEDARRIAALGADGVVVSNHGGRQLAMVPSSIEALPAIRAAVGPDFAVLIDSGVRSGDDIARALASGADFVLLGRTFLYGTAALGAEQGPRATIEILRGELDTAMAQLGCSTIADLRRADRFTPSIPTAPTSRGSA
jgi:(S)-mandelate dehydrogenase